MAGVRFAAVTGQVSTGTAAKTVLQVVAASNHRVIIDEISISFEGTSNTATPIQVRVLRQTTAGTMTALTPIKVDDSADETLQVTAQHTATAEPTASDVFMSELVHPQTGFCWQAPFGHELVCGGADRIGVEVTAAASIDCISRVFGHE